MNRSRIRLLAGATAAGLGLTLAACGSSDSSTPSDPTRATPSAATDVPSTATMSTSAATSPTPSTTGPSTGPTGGATTSAAATGCGLRVGALLPLTGSLASLGPAQVAGVGLAVSDINAAGGVAGRKACGEVKDSGDASDPSTSTQGTAALIADGASVVVGATSSQVSLHVVDTLTSHHVVEISPANTAVELSGYSPWYFRTAPTASADGAVLGSLLRTDHRAKVGFLVLDDPDGTDLRNVVQRKVQSAGGSCVYGCRDQGEELAPGQSSFRSEVGKVLATQPDAIVVLAFGETKAILAELKAKGWTTPRTYLGPDNTIDYGKSLPKGSLTGATGIIPGSAGAAFSGRLDARARAAGTPLSDDAYGAQSYDATILAALAATRGGGTDAATIQKNLAAVSGAGSGSVACTTYAACVAQLKAGKSIRYTGPSGIGPIDNLNDPSSASVDVVRYRADNDHVPVATVKTRS